MSRTNPSRSPESYFEERLLTDAKARRRAPRPELVADVLAVLETRPRPRRRERPARRAPLLVAAALVLALGAALWLGRSDPPAVPIPAGPPPTADTEPPVSFVNRALALGESLQGVLATERQCLALDLRHMNQAIWSGLPQKLLASRR